MFKRNDAQRVWGECSTVDEIAKHQKSASAEVIKTPNENPALTYVFADGSQLAVNPDSDEFYIFRKIPQ